MGFNFGGFAGGFSQGFKNGVDMGEKTKKLLREGQAEDLRTKGMEEARQARELEINGAITSNGVAPTAQSNQAAAASESTAPGANDEKLPVGMYRRDGTQVTGAEPPSATPIAVASPEGQTTQRPLAPQGEAQPAAPAPTQPQVMSGAAENGLPTYTVAGKTYTDPGKARAAAEKNASSTMDLFIKNSASKMREFYVQNGDIETADKWDKWAENAQNKAGMKLWAGAYTAAQAGDWDKAADNFGKYYSDHINDGVQYVGHKKVLGEDGKLMGFAVTLKDEKTGKETDMQLTPQTMLKMGMANNPQALFDSEMKRQTALDAAKVKLAEEMTKQQGRIQLEGVKTGNASKLQEQKDTAALERVTTKAQLDEVKDDNKASRQTAGTVRVLKENGYTDDEVKKMLPAILKIGEHKKTTDPAERANIVASELTKSDPSFSRLPDDKKQEKILSIMKAADGAAKAVTGKTEAAPAPASPAAAGVTGASAPTAGKLPVYDAKSGKIVYR